MIAHVDADAFFASALQRKRPDLRGKPLLALGMGGGCVIAASYEAKACGVKTGMRLLEARKLCPQALAIPSDFDEALSASRQIEQMLQECCPVLQRYSVDEWFLDLTSLVGGVPKDMETWGTDRQSSIAQSVGLTVSIGVGPSKLLAKMASEYRKPAGLTIVSHKHPPRTGRGVSASIGHAQGKRPSFSLDIETFLRDRPAAAIPGIGGRRTLHSHAHGWKTAWDIAQADRETVVHLFGRPGLWMQRELLGEALESVEQDTRPPKSISRCRSFRPTRNKYIPLSHLLHHLTYTILKMRRHNLACTSVAVWLRSGHYEIESKDSKLPKPMDTEEQIFPYVQRCFDRCFSSEKQHTQVGLALLGLKPKGADQYSLFEPPKKVDGAHHVQEALDTLHERFGRESIKRGAAMATAGAKEQRLNLVN